MEPRFTQVIGLVTAAAVLGVGTLGPALRDVDRAVRPVLPVFASTFVI